MASSPPVEVYIEGINDDLTMGSNYTATNVSSIASSSMPSRRSTRLAALFTPDNNRFGNFDSNSTALAILTGRLRLDVTFIARMEAVGYIKMSIIINRFGLDIRSIARAFAVMGPSHILDEQVHTQTMYLVMFARSQTLNWEFLKADPDILWKNCRKHSRTNAAIKNWTDIKHDQLDEFITDPTILELARKEMRMIRAKIRSWIKNDQVSVCSYNNPTWYPPVTTLKEHHSGSHIQLQQQVNDMESNLARQRASILKNDFVPKLEQVQIAVKDVQASINKDIDIAIGKRLQSTMDSRAKDAIKKNLGPLMKNAAPKVVTYDDASIHSNPKSNTELSPIEEDSASEGILPF